MNVDVFKIILGILSLGIIPYIYNKYIIEPMRTEVSNKVKELTDYINTRSSTRVEFTAVGTKWLRLLYSHKTIIDEINENIKRFNEEAGWMCDYSKLSEINRRIEELRNKI